MHPTSGKSDGLILHLTREYTLPKVSSKAATLKLDSDKGLPVESERTNTFQAKFHPRSKDLDYKTDLVNRLIYSARESGQNISNVTGLYGEFYGRKLFTNSEGSVVDWDFEAIDLQCRVTSKTKAGHLVNEVAQVGGTMDLESLAEKDSPPKISEEGQVHMQRSSQKQKRAR
jgi:predicted Zn-dependent protease